LPAPDRPLLLHKGMDILDTVEKNVLENVETMQENIRLIDSRMESLAQKMAQK
jgi:hypothetical protein